MQALAERVQRKREIFATYRQWLGDPSTGSGHRLPGIAFMPEASWGRATRWLTVITVDPAQFGATRPPNPFDSALRSIPVGQDKLWGELRPTTRLLPQACPEAPPEFIEGLVEGIGGWGARSRQMNPASVHVLRQGAMETR